VPTLEECSHCHEMKLPHHVCPNCGYYQGRQAITLKPAGGDDAAR
jgi:large subunit ribosomal protein L32